ncbi:putative O-methyltransferase [Jackrogersella minutella]|nr:putative O-methyltransferase [Jackrogersella minutella]
MDEFQLVVNRLEALTTANVEGHQDIRQRLLASARKVVSSLETNGEKVYDIVFQQSIVYAALKTCLDIGLWYGWARAGGGEKSLQDLAKLTTKDCDLNVLRRFLRLLGTANIIQETGEDRYKPTPFSLSIGDTSGSLAQAIISKTHHWDMSHGHLPSYLAKTSYRQPEDAGNTNYSHACPEGLPLFDRSLQNRTYQDSLRGFLVEWSKSTIPWPEFYDTVSLIGGADFSSGSPLVVDVGGIHGIDLLRLLDKHPDLPAGSLVLQDLAGVLAGTEVAMDKITLMAHDFFETQPIYGSRAYFFHRVFHDWPDAKADQILQNIKPAMKRGYSKLLLYEIVLPRTGASIYQASLDVGLMANLSAYERTEAMWTKLINGAGLRIVHTWMDPGGYEGIIEVELA